VRLPQTEVRSQNFGLGQDALGHRLWLAATQSAQLLSLDSQEKTAFSEAWEMLTHILFEAPQEAVCELRLLAFFIGIISLNEWAVALFFGTFFAHSAEGHAPV